MTLPEGSNFNEDGELEQSVDFEYPPEGAPALDPASALAIESIARLAELLDTSSNPKLTLDCLRYASGAFEAEPLTIGDICRKHGISRKSAHKHISRLWCKLGLPRPLKSTSHLRHKCQGG